MTAVLLRRAGRLEQNIARNLVESGSFLLGTEKRPDDGIHSYKKGQV
jgi:hypothetical protein